MLKKYTVIILFFIIAGIGVGAYLFFGKQDKKVVEYSGPTDKIVLGSQLFILSSPIWVAESQGYFKKNGLEVVIKEFDSGKTALNTMLNEGGLDIVTVAQGPFTINSFKRQDFDIISMLSYSYKNDFVLGRRDKGIEIIDDLRGKKIGVTFSTSGHYFLDLFLLLNHIQESEVTQVDLPAGKLISALSSGEVDAIATWQPYAYKAQKELGESIVSLTAENIFREDFYLVANQDIQDKNPDALVRFLKSIKEADDFMDKNKDQSVAIVASRTNLPLDFVSAVWEDYTFRVFLDQNIMIALENSAQWAIRKKLIESKSVPNYLRFVNTEFLKKIDSGAVTIIK